MVENGIFSHEDLVEHLRTGVEFYPALEGLRTVHNDEKTISDLLAEPEIAERMATQIESKVQIRSREELGVSEPLKEEKTEHEVTPKEIAEADKEQALTTAEVGRFKKILNKLKEFFKGKGEK